MERVLELEFVTSKCRVGWNELTVEEIKGLQVLQEERDLLQRENMERDREQMETDFQTRTQQPPVKSMDEI